MRAASPWPAAALLAAALGAPACADAREPGGETAAGAEIYEAADCAGCHESAAVPGMVVRPLAKLASRYDVTSLAAFLAAPNPPMPLFPLSEEQRSELARYLLERFP